MTVCASYDDKNAGKLATYPDCGSLKDSSSAFASAGPSLPALCPLPLSALRLVSRPRRRQKGSAYRAASATM